MLKIYAKEYGAPLRQILLTFPSTKLAFHFIKLLQTFSVNKINSPFYKIKLRIMILTFHISKLSGYHNINM